MTYDYRVLRVDLSNGNINKESLPEEMVHDYIGGRGIGAKMLYDELKPGIDPLGEDNEIIFMAGPLAGTFAQGFSRWKIFFKSPLTKLYCKASGGGNFGAELRFAGFDIVVIKGKAPKPVYLWIHDGKYELRDATKLWGTNNQDTNTLIRLEHHDPKISMVTIGPAGERLVKYASVDSDRVASAARGGGGAVMGSKNLKAIAVRGSEKVSITDPEAFRKAVKEQIDLIKSNEMFPMMNALGSQGAPEAASFKGWFPTRNFKEGILPDVALIAGAQYTQRRVGKDACYSCMIGCKNWSKAIKGKYAGVINSGPEFESIWAFTGPMRISNPDLTIAADLLCDQLGIDTISTGNTIGFAYELYERGLISKKDTGGLELVWGNEEPLLELIRQIGLREGIGNLLAEGVREVARQIGHGSEDYAVHIKGMEVPAQSPQGNMGHALSMATTSIGADHNSGYGTQEAYGNIWKGQRWNRFTTEGKGEIAKFNQDHCAATETGIMCHYLDCVFMEDLGLYGKLLAPVTGVSDHADPEYLWLVGERINNLERMFNVREGIHRKDDKYPARITKEVLHEGPGDRVLYEEDTLLDDYYKARGWDVKTGVPTAAKLKKLGLAFTIKR